ncbi:MAG: DUF1622 domain-containing protein [Gemmatimonadales bacterium]
MEGALHNAARYVALGLDGLSLLMVVIGAAEAIVAIGQRVVRGRTSGWERRRVWMGFAHWLVAALTFQLGADIVRTIIDSGWEEIGRVGAIAAIRTFLTYFLERDIEAMHATQREASSGGHDAGPG